MEYEGDHVEMRVAWRQDLRGIVRQRLQTKRNSNALSMPFPFSFFGWRVSGSARGDVFLSPLSHMKSKRTHAERG